MREQDNWLTLSVLKEGERRTWDRDTEVQVGLWWKLRPVPVMLKPEQCSSRAKRA